MIDKATLDAFASMLNDNNKQLLVEMKNIVQLEVAPIKADLSDVKERVKCIELTLENEIPKRLDSLYEGYCGNRELIEELRVLEQETNSMVSALDIAKFVQSGNGKNLKVIK